VAEEDHHRFVFQNLEKMLWLAFTEGEARSLVGTL
jgi:hypothetical protein